MRIRQFLAAYLAFFLCESVLSKEIVLDVELVPVRQMAFVFTPVVLPDLISAKFAFEYRLDPKFNLIIPVEAKWMDYRKAIKLFSSAFGGPNNVPEDWYHQDQLVKVLWNIDISQLKISSGIGAKWFPFGESMSNAFFLKTALLFGYEHLNAFSAEGPKDGVVFTHVFTIGYNWFKGNRFLMGFEIGEEYSIHSNPIKNMPILLDGFMPIMQFSLGFAI